jgi:aminoglycoside phosphotransferase (APT) family kinase protein
VTAPPGSRDGAPWQSEREVSPAQARALLAAQFPALALETIEPFGQGWDNVALLVDRTWVVRFPRRSPAAGWMRAEIAALPIIAPRLGVAVPLPELIGEPSADYPWPFAGYRLLPGTTACRVDLDAPARAALAAPIGRALRALHGMPATAWEGRGIPSDDIKRLDRALRLAKAHAGAPAAAAALPGAPAAALLVTAAEAAAAQAREPRRICLVHGDLYARHLLLDAEAGLCGIIDWGDTHIGDPAIDLALAYTVLPAGARSAFWSAYGAVDAPTRALARLRAIVHTIALAPYASAMGDAALMDACRIAFANAMEPP